MVVALGPGRFYGSSLPRPRFYTDIKFSDERVSPPLPVMDPLMSWAEEAHWSMGGLSLKRHRLQGRIEGNVIKLRAEREKFQKIRNEAEDKRVSHSAPVGSKRKVLTLSPSPPPAPIANKRRRRYVGFVDDSEGEDDGEEKEMRRRPARKLTEDFDRVAAEGGLKKKSVNGSSSPVKSSGSGSEGVGLRTRSRKSEVIESENEKVGLRRKEKGSSSPASAIRASPRLVKKGAKLFAR